jgi:hypothetical protein
MEVKGKMKTRSTILFTFVAMFYIGFLTASPSIAISLGFEQLNWFGTTTSTPDSSWGRVQIDYTGLSDVGYFNLNVNGNWVVQNLSVGSIYGSGINQTFTTMFDLGVSDGNDVTSLDYYSSIDLAPVSSYSVGALLSTSVADLDYQIGGEDGYDLGSPGAPNPAAGTTSKVKKSGKLPNIDKFKNQEQKQNECAPGAISNSLKYLNATGRISGIPDNISDVKTWTPWIDSANGTGANWPAKKKEYLEKHGMTVRNIEVPLTYEKVIDLIDQLNAGQDIEMDLKGHVETLVGIRLKEDGTVDLDLYDDNQLGDGVDKMHTSTLMTDGTNQLVDKMVFERMVVECPVPEPATLLGFGVPMLMIGLGKLKKLRL